ncbi:hypothetical protein [Streptomyces sp. NPDC001820]|uniref:hypothetical protein n=1 Tax=Streptomyces sp. NPDC001820 TaxID=3364613 RepID=UPI00369EF947
MERGPAAHGWVEEKRWTLARRLRGLLTQIHPHLERVLGPRVQHLAGTLPRQRGLTEQAADAAIDTACCLL